MDVTIRRSGKPDQPAILSLVRDAFTSEEHDGQEEVDIVERTWALGARIEGLELVAVSGGAVVGHVLGASGHLDSRQIVAVAPLCVSPARQGEGIGTSLMEQLIRSAERQRWPVLVLLGDPPYYRRFGFEPSGPLGIVYPPVGPNDPHFQVRRMTGFDASFQGQVTYCWEREG